MSGPSAFSEGYPTPKRHSLVSPARRGIDQDRRLLDGRRAVAYAPSGSIALQAVRDRLTAEGLILGRRSPGMSTGDREVYIVPTGARPLSLEAPQSRQGIAAYSDAELVRDLGALMARISRAAGGRVVAHPAEGAIALIDFVPAGEPHLYAVPGIEKWLTADPVTEGERVGAQRGAFSGSFSEWVGMYSSDYGAGYSAVQNGELS